MKEDRYSAASAAQTKPDFSNMTELEKKSALRQMQRARLQAANERKPKRTHSAAKPVAEKTSKQPAQDRPSQQPSKPQRPVVKKKKRRSLAYAIFAALKLEIQEAKASREAKAESRKKPAADFSRETKSKKASLKPIIVQQKQQPAVIVQNPQPAVEEKPQPAVVEEKPQTPAQPIVAEEPTQVPVQSVAVEEQPQTQAPVQPVVVEENPQPAAVEEMPQPQATVEAVVADEQPSTQPAVADKPKQTDKKTWIVAAVIFCSIMLATLAFLGVRSATAANDFRDLSQQVRDKEAELATSEPVEDIPLATTEPVSVEAVVETEPVETEPPVKTIMPKYADLVVENPELFGWIRIDDTVLDYPVMRSTADNQKYLYANFDGKYSFAGTPFAENVCSADSDNILIYGHNIKDGSMFRSLFKYEKQSYWEKHPTIMFSDLYEDYEYEVMAVFYDRVYKKTDDVFKFYQFIDAEDEADFDYAVSQFKEKSLYDTGVDAQYGDKLITLVTCSYQVENGRFVVVARRK